MNSRKWLGTFIQIIAMLSFLLFATGFILSIQDILSPPTTNALNQREKTSSPLTDQKGLVVGLGDSLTRGIGDEKGLGYIGIVRQQIEEKNDHLPLINLAVSGQTSSELLQQLQQKQVQQLIRQAQWLTVTIGGNDLKNSGMQEDQKIDLKQAETNRKQFEKNLEQILTTIRLYNQPAPVFLFSLYNPYGDLADRELTSKVVLEWNETIQDIGRKHPNVIIIPTYDLFQMQPKKYLASDHFHPNHQGYQRMAARLMQIIQDTPMGRSN